jgi:hypothetical protein
MIFVHTCKKTYWFAMYVNDHQQLGWLSNAGARVGMGEIARVAWAESGWLGLFLFSISSVFLSLFYFYSYFYFSKPSVYACTPYMHTPLVGST